MNTARNGGDPRTYKKVQDDNNTNSNYQNDLSMNVSPLNDAGTMNTDIFNANPQQTSSSTSTTNGSESMGRPSSNHGTIS